MSHKEKLIAGFQTMMQILQPSDENTAEMQAVACDLPNTEKQEQKTVLFGGQSPFIALVLHQGNEHFLPGLHTATRLPEKPMYRNKEFVDLAFFFESKLYPCKMNENVKQSIKAFIDRFYR